MIELNWKIMFKWKVNWLECKYSRNINVFTDMWFRLKRKDKIRNIIISNKDKKGAKESQRVQSQDK